jgi:membrane protein DedA with SNARE-associated domain
VFFGRFLLGLRTWASWLAGATRMHWRVFAFWNAAGGICWATAIGIIGYELGKSAGGAIEDFGIYGVVAVVVAIISGVVLRRRHVHGLARTHSAGEDAPEAPSSSQDHEPLPPDGA